ncbi:MAG TPA: hypothetical protein VGR35_04385 [Tepidisphaeraceae bacterium]|nr:hypothetical protein [Tepidisphaeraceae bacterium]
MLAALSLLALSTLVGCGTQQFVLDPQSPVPRRLEKLAERDGPLRVWYFMDNLDREVTEKIANWRGDEVAEHRGTWTREDRYAGQEGPPYDVQQGKPYVVTMRFGPSTERYRFRELHHVVEYLPSE